MACLRNRDSENNYAPPGVRPEAEGRGSFETEAVTPLVLGGSVALGGADHMGHRRIPPDVWSRAPLRWGPAVHHPDATRVAAVGSAAPASACSAPPRRRSARPRSDPRKKMPRRGRWSPSSKTSTDFNRLQPISTNFNQLQPLQLLRRIDLAEARRVSPHHAPAAHALVRRAPLRGRTRHVDFRRRATIRSPKIARARSQISCN